MRIIPRLAVLVVVLAICVMVVLPVSAARADTSNLLQAPLGTHIVQQGEWLYCIGRAYQVPPWEIAKASGIPGPYGPNNPYAPWYNPWYNPWWYPWNNVYPGQVLTIPAIPWYNIPAGPTCAPQPTVVLPNPWPPPQPTPVPQPTVVYPPVSGCVPYYVQWGNTLSGIAWHSGTSVGALMAANPQIWNPNLIFAGSTLCIPPGGNPYGGYGY